MRSLVYLLLAIPLLTPAGCSVPVRTAAVGPERNTTAADAGGALRCETSSRPGWEFRSDVSDLCRRMFAPVASNDTEAWLSQVLERVEVDPALVNRVDIPLGERVAALRAAARRAGGVRGLIGQKPGEPVRVIVERDCRQCRKPYVVFRVVGSPDVIVIAEGCMEPAIERIALDAPGLGATVEELTARAWLVVRGRFESGPLISGAVMGSLRVAEVVKGSAPTAHLPRVFLPAGMNAAAGREGTYFLIPRHLPEHIDDRVDGWTVLMAEDSVTFARGTARTARLHAGRDEPFEARAVRGFAADLALLRGADRHRYHRENAPVVAAARRVFAGLDFTGVDRDQVERLLGRPAETGNTDGGTYRLYNWHDGEIGVIRRLEFSGVRVERVVALPTQ